MAVKKLIVTRHPALVQYLKDKGYIDDSVEHLTFAAIADVKDKHVFGILPNWLACHTDKFTEVQLRLPTGKRATELTMDEIKFYANKPRTYIIREVETERNIEDGKDT